MNEPTEATGPEILIDPLVNAGVDTVFGLPTVVRQAFLQSGRRRPW
jgi:hypothetical protein